MITVIPYFLAFMVANSGGGPYYDSPPPTPQLQVSADDDGKPIEYRTLSDCLIAAEEQDHRLRKAANTFLLDATCTTTRPKQAAGA
jgi:hypothetical protein